MRTSRSLILPLLLAAVLSPAAIVHAQEPAESPTPEALVQGVVFSKTAVMTFRRHQGEWRALLSGSLEGFAQRFAAMAGG